MPSENYDIILVIIPLILALSLSLSFKMIPFFVRDDACLFPLRLWDRILLNTHFIINEVSAIFVFIDRRNIEMQVGGIIKIKKTDGNRKDEGGRKGEEKKV